MISHDSFIILKELSSHQYEDRLKKLACPRIIDLDKIDKDYLKTVFIGKEEEV